MDFDREMEEVDKYKDSETDKSFKDFKKEEKILDDLSAAADELDPGNVNELRKLANSLGIPMGKLLAELINDAKKKSSSDHDIRKKARLSADKIDGKFDIDQEFDIDDKDKEFYESLEYATPEEANYLLEMEFGWDPNKYAPKSSQLIKGPDSSSSVETSPTVDKILDNSVEPDMGGLETGEFGTDNDGIEVQAVTDVDETGDTSGEGVDVEKLDAGFEIDDNDSNVDSDLDDANSFDDKGSDEIFVIKFD